MSNREIDALCAEKVMGWKLLEGYQQIVAAGYAKANPEPPAFQSGDKARYHYRRVWVNDKNWRMACEECGDLPHYSTDPAASKQLRDKMRADGFIWQLTYDTAVSDGPYVFVLFGPNCVGCWKAYADTEEMAVALAALKAVGVQQEEK